MSKKKIFIIVFLVLITLLGSGAGYYFIFNDNKIEDIIPLMQEDKKYELNIKAITVPIIRNSIIIKYLIIRLVLVFDDKDNLTLSKEKMPNILNNLIETLYIYFSRLPLNSPIYSKIINKLLLTNIGGIIGKNKVVDIKIKSIYEKIE